MALSFGVRKPSKPALTANPMTLRRVNGNLGVSIANLLCGVVVFCCGTETLAMLRVETETISTYRSDAGPLKRLVRTCAAPAGLRTPSADRRGRLADRSHPTPTYTRPSQ